MSRQEVWAVYARGARRYQRTFVVLTIETDPEVPEPCIGSLTTEPMPVVRLAAIEQFDLFEP